MEFWEFLIQKEGDRSWLPLESLDVEVLEGRYRMVARSHRIKTPVEIRISHTNLIEQPPRRRSQTRSNQTNDEGLMVIFPYTWLHPGVWEVHCQAVTAGDRAHTVPEWQESVQLQVLPQESDVADDWIPELPAADRDASLPDLPSNVVPLHRRELTDTTEVSLSEQSEANPFDAAPLQAPLTEPVQGDAAPQDAATLRQRAEAASDAMMDDILGDLLSEELSDEEPPTLAPTPGHVTAEASADRQAIAPHSLQLVLAQPNLIAQPGGTFVLNGSVEGVEGQTQPYLPPVALQITLRDPQTAEVVLETRRSLTSRLLPCPFSCHISLPNPLYTRLLTGDIALVTLDTPTQEGSCLLASELFSVTVSLHELLEAIANDSTLQNATTEPQEATPLTPDLTFLDLTVTRTQPTPPVAPQERLILPPKLYQPDSDRSRHQGIQLPTMHSEPDAPDDAPSPAPIPTPVPPEIPKTEAETPNDLHHVLNEADEVWQQVTGHEAENPEATLPHPDLALSAEDLAFQSLDLENRFLSRLSSLAGDRELSQFLGDRSTPLPDSDLDDQEIVVEEPPAFPPRRNSLFLHATPTSEEPLAMSMDEDLESESPLPTPELRVLPTELVSGQRVEVTVTLPANSPRLGVKLWIQDLQNRALLEGPHWLMNFLPNGRGALEAWTMLTVPHGCLELQFEAIAVEIATQRESHKATLDRPVIPPDLPSLSLDELEI